MAEQVNNIQKRSYIDFGKEELAGHYIKLSIKEGGQSVSKIKKAEKVGKVVSTTIVYLILIFLALIMILPFYWMIITSLKITLKF